jgi:adenylate kinase family enzyme
VTAPRRILIYGVYGAGKSTLAAHLARLLRLPWQPVDDLTWEPGWKEVPVALQRRRIAEICRGPAWIIDGGYQAWLDIPFERADLVVCLDYSRRLTLGRLIRRTWQRVRTQEVVCNGNRESWGSVLSSESILVWHLGSFARKRRRMRQWHGDPATASRVLLLRTPRQTAQWLQELSGVPQAAPTRR